MDTLRIDIETYSEVDLLTSGVYKYAEHPSFQVLLFAYSLNYSPVQLVDLAQGQEIPPEIIYHLCSPDTLKIAQNANFERVCLAKHLGRNMSPKQWTCTMVHALQLGLPGSLAKLSEVLDLEEDQKKMKEGKALITYFCKPCKATKANGMRTRNLPHHAPEKWELFKKYCTWDVVAESGVGARIAFRPLPADEQQLWTVDQDITDRGVKLDRELIIKAMTLDTMYRDRLKAEAQEITQLSNINSMQKVKEWLYRKTGREYKSLAKDIIPKILEECQDPEVERVLNIRQELGKTSTSKYDAMARCICKDDRARGLIQFYGANRTGRWAGRLVQVQNLPQNKIPDLDLARQLLKDGKFEGFEMLYGNVPFILSQLIRTAFIPSEGNKFYVADYSAIEARMIAWLAGEKWRMDVFNTHGKIYEASAAQMFGVDIETIVKGHENYSLRAKGKVAELALGYGGGYRALEAFGADKYMDQKEMKALVKKWRNTSPAITDLWWSIDEAAVEAVQYGRVTGTHGVEFRVENGYLFVTLPSGRSLAYPRVHLKENKYGKTSIAYYGIDDKKKWAPIDTYGPKLVENIVQALSRDCLAFAIQNLEGAGYKIVMHVHDEVIIDHGATAPDTVLKAIEDIMGRVPPWAEGLPLNADGYHCEFYKKD